MGKNTSITKTSHNDAAVIDKKTSIKKQNHNKTPVEKKNVNKSFNITCFGLLKFFLKILINEKSYTIFFIVTNIFSIIVSLVFNLITNEKTKNQLFDFYAIIYSSVLIFLLIVRFVMFFYVKKEEDKTTFIIISNAVSRTLYFFTMLLSLVLLVLFTIFLSYLYFNIMCLFINRFEISSFVMRKTTTFLVFNILTNISLLFFIVFFVIVAGSQATIITTTVLLSLSFVANIPLKLITNNYQNLNLTFTKLAFRVSDVYDTINLQDKIKNNKTKYNTLSNTINNFYTNFEDRLLLKDNFSQGESINERYYNLWDSVFNIINKNSGESKLYTLKGKVLTLNEQMNKAPNLWNDKNVTINFKLKDSFMNINEITELYNNLSNDDYKKPLLNDFINFYNELTASTIDLQSTYPNYFSTFIHLLSDDKFKSEVISEEGSRLDFTTTDLDSIYNLAVNPDPLEPYGKLTLTDIATDNSIRNFFYNDFYFPVSFVVSVLENYFINYTSKFYYISNYSLVNDSNYKNYQSLRNQVDLFSYLNPFYGVWASYTLYSGNSYNNVWFSNQSVSSINFEDQENIFLPYTTYSFKLDQNKISSGSTNNYYNPMNTVSLILVASFLMMIYSYYVFTKKDIS
ncbi:hypothetical protein SCORR_v1c06520 [Spiroplasma corruscae]|uniref:Uncharacterized protein n=1 Tax=Spiroplasma corruscae TaxID=216934 RepID=A0A222EQ66_9MOLU|nr:hypothetical protein [Spiroplasma corruscae]ASP28424.1 hypothetical protein SCORR_v1c06520 [Spiroplasma corruscae]